MELIKWYDETVDFMETYSFYENIDSRMVIPVTKFVDVQKNT